ISGLHITGTLYAHANNIRVIDSVIDGGIVLNQNSRGMSYYPVKANMYFLRVTTSVVNSVGLKNVTFDSCHFGGVAGTFMQATKYRDRGVEFAADRLTVKNSLFDGLQAAGPGSKHLEAVHLMGVTRATLRNNYFNFVPPDDFTRTQTTAVLTLESSYLGTMNEKAVIDANWFVGGGWYQIYLYGPGISVTNNRFSRSAAHVQYPPSAYAGSGLGWYPISHSGNRASGGRSAFSVLNR
ncbi:MAG: hypothetical protein JWM93_278, partial [Frankiales bacterium]|nr:hypothetical protein [Frankiales bacterium]